MLFQLSLALGFPWGELAMGGKYPGRFPPKMRIVAIAQIVVLGLISLIVLTRAGMLFWEYFTFSKTAIWGRS